MIGITTYVSMAMRVPVWLRVPRVSHHVLAARPYIYACLFL